MGLDFDIVSSLPLDAFEEGNVQSPTLVGEIGMLYGVTTIQSRTITIMVHKHGIHIVVVFEHASVNRME